MMKIKENFGVETTYFNQLDIGDIYCYADNEKKLFMVVKDIDESKKVIGLPDGYIQMTVGDLDRKIIKLDCELLVKR